MRKHHIRSYQHLLLLIVITFLSSCAYPPAPTAIPQNAAFVVIPLGTKGGLDEADLSAYLVARADSTDFIAFDAGTLFAGLRHAVRQGSFANIHVPPDVSLSPEGFVLQKHIKAYMVSHAHLDHVAGLVINSTDDSAKPILGLPATIDNIRDHLFNWKIWPNFGDEGDGFKLKKYHYVRLTPGSAYPIEQTPLSVTPFELSHSGGYVSTAFLIEADRNYLLCFGDTGPDAVEKSQNMKKIWTAVAPLIRAKQLRGIMLEASYPSDQPDKQLFGHLTPKWMMTELRTLAALVNPDHPETALRGIKVVVTHIKPIFDSGKNPAATIMRELTSMNDLGAEFVLPESGKRIFFERDK